MPEAPTIAVWYGYVGGTSVELLPNQDEAVAFAYHLEQEGHGYVLGIQEAPDGTTTPRDEWRELHEYENRPRLETRIEPTPEAKRVYCPLAPSRFALLIGDIPKWLGAHESESDA